jgi:hypothetical protein
MNRLAIPAVAAALLALATTAGAWRGWVPDALLDQGKGSAAGSGTLRVVREDASPAPAGPAGYADARTPGTAYYGWRYPFALPFPSALATAHTPQRTRPR